jgi:uncharacterized protein (TIGR03435 family)
MEVRALRRSAHAADDGLRERVAHLAARMGIRRQVHLVTSTRAESPGVIGWLRPLILLPPAIAMGLTTAQLDAVLAHELAHIRRHDYLVNVIQMMAETLLFYHPAVWWVSKQLRIERELCCDDEAVGVCGDAAGYARALVTMARLQVPSMAMGSTGGSLSDRVRRLLGVSSNEPRRSAPLGIVVLAVALTSIALAGADAQPQRPRFEVVSIRPSTSQAPGLGLQFFPGGVARGARVPVRGLIAVAYGVSWKHIEGNSDLLDQQFAIDARADVSALPPEASTLERTLLGQAAVLRQMVQTLLAERFRLAIHIERRDSPVYALVVGPNGPRLTPAARDCAPKTVAEATEPGAAPCGFQGGGPARGLRLHAMELSHLAEALSNFVDRDVVVDRTGIPGRFDIDLPPWSTGAPPREPIDAAQAAEPQPDPEAPSLFTALQQLGLRLEPARAPVDIYVIDHLEPPTEN